MRLVVLLALASLSGCVGGTMRVRLDVLAGARLEIAGRDREIDVTLPVAGDFEVVGGAFAYPVTLTLPAPVAARYGGSGEVVLAGELHVNGPTRAYRGGVEVAVPLDEPTRAAAENEIGRLVRGEISSCAIEAVDQGWRQYRMVRLVLRRAR